MRVLQLGKFFPIRGGVEKVMYDLMTGLCARGIHSDMLCAAYRGRSRTVDAGAHSKVFCCRTWARLCSTCLSPAMIIRALRILRRYDVVSIHHPDPMAAVALFFSRYRGRVILHWHSDIVRQRAAKRLYRPLQDWLIRRADVVIATSPAYIDGSPDLRAALPKALCLPIGTGPLCPDPEAVERVRRAYGGRKIIFSLGRMVPYKGFEYLIQAAAYLDDGWVIVIGGDGPLRARLQNEVRMCGLRNRVVLRGYVPQSELPAYFGACRLFCLPSVEKTEAYGIVQVEAFSCSRPVVATRIEGSGVSWVNRHGFSGLNVPPRDAGALAGAFRSISDDERTWSAFCRNARSRYQELFTRERMVREYQKILRSCLNG